MGRPMSKLFSFIGPSLRHLRLNRDLSLRELSDRSGVHISNLSRIENGKSIPGLDTIDKIVTALGYDLGDLNTIMSVIYYDRVEERITDDSK